MRKVIFLLIVILSLPTTLWAADPIIGTWELNIAESKLSPLFPTIKSQKEVYQELDSGQIKMTLTRTLSDGKIEISTGIWPSQGGIIEGGSIEGELLVETLVAPGEWYVTRMRDGKQYGLMHKVVSKDGKTYRLRYLGLNDEGMLVETGVTVFDRI